MAIGFPNRDGSHNLALHLPFEGDESFAQIDGQQSMQAFLSARFPDLVPHLGDAVASLARQRPNAMLSVSCAPWAACGRVLLIGDAAHAILPHYGQGANAGFEDCRVLAELIEAEGPDWSVVCEAFERRRRPDAHAISELCHEHAHELHATVASPAFARHMQLERRLQRVCPERVMPLYSMISFTEMPYGQLRARDRVQRRMIADLMAGPAGEAQLDDPVHARAWRARIERELPPLNGGCG